MQKDNENEWLKSVSEDFDYTTMHTDKLSEDPEFPSIQAKKENFTDKARKEKEIQNSTIGGF